VVEGAGNATFTVTLSEASDQAVTVTYVVQAAGLYVGNPATLGQDYVPLVTVGTLTIPAGQTSAQISVPVAPDGVYEGNEVFSVVLSNPSNATIAQGTGSGTIVDDDLPALSVLSGPTVTEGQGSVFIVQLSQPSASQAVVIQLEAQGVDGDALPGVRPGADTTGALEYFDAASGAWQPIIDGRLTFAPGQTAWQVRVATSNDRTVEGSELLRLQAKVVSGDTQNASAASQNVILDNDFEATLYESLLAGRSDPTPPTFSGRLELRDDVGALVTDVRLVAPTETVLASINQQPLVWTETAPNTLVATAGSAQGAPVVATARLSDDGAYTLELQSAIRHPVTQSQVDLVFGLQPVGSPAQAGSLNLHVIDDQPRLAATFNSLANAVDTNVVLVLDTSASMSMPSGVDGLTRLQAAVKAMGELLDRYDDVGNVAVRLVTFGEQATALGDAWISVPHAKIFLAGVQVDSGATARLDLALEVVEAAHGSPGQIAGAQGVAHFFAGAQPSDPVILALNQEQAAWVEFLKRSHIRSEVVGLSPDIAASSLGAVAYDGVAQADLNAHVLASSQQLPGFLEGVSPDPIAGNLIRDAGRSVATGADGVPHLDGVTIDGKTYAYQDGVNLVEITTNAGGVFTVNMVTSDFTYAPAGAVKAETVSFSVTDRDGDTAGSTLVLKVDQAITRSGTDAADVMGVSSGAGILLGGGGDDTLTGGSGKDALYGQAGNDRLSGGSSADRLAGGAGNDVLVGGAGSDVFAWRLGDAPDAGGAVDTITDFSTRPVSVDGDVLDLRDLLQGENLLNVGGNIADYLRIETFGSGSTAGTRIDISSQGGFTTGGAHIDQQIVLEKTNLLALSAAGASQQQVIVDLIAQRRLLVDVT
jgi:hypothetical protein